MVYVLHGIPIQKPIHEGLQQRPPSEALQTALNPNCLYAQRNRNEKVESPLLDRGSHTRRGRAPAAYRAGAAGPRGLAAGTAHALAGVQRSARDTMPL